jgi:membrane-bound metal-dependent hydrolase YbcI (DUF457 family)
MDFITHSLMATGAVRLAVPEKVWRPQLALAAVLGSLLQDADSWLYLIGPEYYGKYHRIASHTVWGLALIALACAAAAWGLAAVRPWRRFGWFVETNLAPGGDLPPRAPFRWFFLVALMAAYLHFAADLTTGFGNLLFFWPWSSFDFSLRAVNSFDWVIFSCTLGWHIVLRRLEWPRRREAVITAVYALLIIGYVAARLLFAEPTIW